LIPDYFLLENESMTVPHLLVIEDDPDIASLLKLDLTDVGYRVSHASSVMSGLTRLREDAPDLVLLDLGLPDGTGHDVLKRIRKHSGLPVIVLTAQGDLNSKVELLDLGADDYLVKPFDHKELLARIAVQLKRFASDLMHFGALEISAAQHMVRYAGEVILLSPTEFRILQLLLDEPGLLYSKAKIFSEIWGEHFQRNDNLLAVHMTNLRIKLRKAGASGLIRTVRGFGFAMHVQRE